MHLKVLKVLSKYGNNYPTLDSLKGYFKFKYGSSLDFLITELLSMDLICKSGVNGNGYILNTNGKKYLAYRSYVNRTIFLKAFFAGLGVLASICTVAGFLLPLFT